MTFSNGIEMNAHIPFKNGWVLLLQLNNACHNTFVMLLQQCTQ